MTQDRKPPTDTTRDQNSQGPDSKGPDSLGPDSLGAASQPQDRQTNPLRDRNPQAENLHSKGLGHESLGPKNLGHEDLQSDSPQPDIPQIAPLVDGSRSEFALGEASGRFALQGDLFTPAGDDLAGDVGPDDDPWPARHPDAAREAMDFDAEFDAFLHDTAVATARPDPAAKAAHLRLAQENFAALQGSRDGARHMTDGRKGLWHGVRDMMQKLSTRGGLTLTTAVVAGGLLVLSPQGRNLLLPPAPMVPASLGTTGSDVAGPDETPMAEMAAAPQAQIEAEVEVEEGQPETAAADVGAATSAVTATPEVAPLAADSAADVAPLAEPMADALSAPAGGRMAEQMAPPPMAVPPNALSRVAPGMVMPHPAEAPAMAETYANAPAQGVQNVVDAPVSTFSVDVDTASWSLLRQSLNFGQLPPPDALRIEEMVNYFPYDYAPPPAGEDAPFAVHTALIDTPWNPDTRLLRIGLQGAVPTERPPLNLVFLIDTSGSMEDPAKLPLLTAALRLMLPELSPQDEVAIVTYAGAAGVALPPTPAGERDTIAKALTGLTSGGGTAGAAGLAEAYALADSMRAEGEISRVILATDGDFNIGPADPAELERLIGKASDGGSYLSVLGFGRGNLNDAIMQSLAQNGNGIAAYVDTLAEAQKVLVDQLVGALFPIADDLKVQVEFNPATVAEYRLIGYETRALAREDFNDDSVDAGEIGAGHAVTALYEITPVGSPAVLTDPLRYGDTAASADSDELAFLRLRWKAPGADDSRLLEQPIADVVAPDPEAAFAAAIAGFGEVLRGDGRTGTWTLQQARDLAAANTGPDPYGYRREAVALIDLAARLQE